MTTPPHHGPAQPRGDRAEDWDDRYRGDDGAPLWSGRPNATLVDAVGGRPPGRALDVGAGEGADAIWLAQQGWEVTALEISQVAVDRGMAASQEAGVVVSWVQGDLMDRPTESAYDLVSVHYPALPISPAGLAINALLDAVSPGGTLLAVGHDVSDPTHALAHGFDPADYVQPADVAGALDDSWEVVTNEVRARRDAVPPGAVHTHDVILEARRRR